MAELLECTINGCGFKTVRCGMLSHLKKKHPDHYGYHMKMNQRLAHRATINDLCSTIGRVTNWRKNPTQVPKPFRLKDFRSY